MAGVRFAGEVQVTTGTSTLTFMQIIAAAQQRIRLERVRISGRGADPTHTPVLFELLRQTTAGTGTSALTLVKLNESDDETLQSTANVGSTPANGFGGEPTASFVKAAQYIHPQAIYDFVFPPGRDLFVKGGERLGIHVVTPTQSNTWSVYFEAEE